MCQSGYSRSSSASISGADDPCVSRPVRWRGSEELPDCMENSNRVFGLENFRSEPSPPSPPCHPYSPRHNAQSVCPSVVLGTFRTQALRERPSDTPGTPTTRGAPRARGSTGPLKVHSVTWSTGVRRKSLPVHKCAAWPRRFTIRNGVATPFHMLNHVKSDVRDSHLCRSQIVVFQGLRFRIHHRVRVASSSRAHPLSSVDLALERH